MHSVSSISYANASLFIVSDTDLTTGETSSATMQSGTWASVSVLEPDSTEFVCELFDSTVIALQLWLRNSNRFRENAVSTNSSRCLLLWFILAYPTE